MISWLHKQRLDAALGRVRESGARSILDLGCGDGDFLIRLAQEPQIERIVGIDINRNSLDRLRERLGAIKGKRMAQVHLNHGSITESDAALAGFDCAVLIETIEHLPPDRLPSLERTVFIEARPQTVVVTTPNAEFNQLLGVPSRRFRHPGHRFEWDRATFREWAHDVAARNAYKVRCSDIAGQHPMIGGASQMAVFKAAR